MSGKNISLLEPWQLVSDPEAHQLERELQRELKPGHVIFGRQAIARGFRLDCDDTLFELFSPSEYALVHLTYGNEKENSDWPFVELYSDFDDFKSRRMHPDYLDWIGAVGK